jgi:di/tricarboxylate transporter
VGPVRLLTGPRAVGGAVAVLVLAAAALLPPPAGLDRSAMLALGAALGAVPLLVFGLLPDYAVALALVAVLVVSGAAPPAVALGGFASPSWVMALVLFATGAALARSGLLYRLALFAVVKLPSNFGAQSLAVALAGLTVSMGVTNGTPRVALAGPAVRAAAEALRLPRRSAGAAALGLIAYVAFGETNALFVTSSSSALMLQALMPGPEAARVTWGFWFAAGVAPNLAFLALSCLAIVLLLRPPFHVAVDPENVRLQRRLLGPITRTEAACIAALVVLVAGFATQGYHGIGPPWVAVGACLVLVLLGALDPETFRDGVSWGTMVYLGALIGLGGVFARLGIDGWLAGAVVGPLAAVVKNPYAFVLAVGLAAFALHFVVPLATASPLLALATMPLAIAAGYSPLVPALTVILAGDHMVLPYVGTHYRALLATTEGELFDDHQARPLLLLSPLFRLLALVASVPYWQALGLM